mmetsp:Transcript_65194/g.121536  ORF Transcript_65194/g.121536 Transcript_65194/m.121536 type:complete len:171 (+) Transcript_65194:59-571(+)
MSSELAAGTLEAIPPEVEPNHALLTPEEEMQFQRALWVNRLLKEQLARETQGLTIKEIEEAQATIQARMRDMKRQAAPQGEPSRRGVSASPRSVNLTSSTSRGPPAIQFTAHSATQRRKREAMIRDENAAFLKRLESVRSSFSPRLNNPSTQVPRLSPCSRLLGHGTPAH